MADKDIEKILGRDAPLEFWIQEAGKHVAPINSITTPEAIAIIQNAFSREWLDECVKTKEKGSALNSSKHPLAKLILLPSKNQVQKVLELAIYLRELHAASNLDQVIMQMKASEDFENTFLQLAYGYRFHKIGVTDLKFEPDVDGGRKADIQFTYDSHQYLVECYMPEIKQSWQVAFTEKLSQSMSDYAQSKNKKICVKAFLRSNPPFKLDERKAFEKDCKNLVDQANSTTYRETQAEGYQIQVCEISSLPLIEQENFFRRLYNEGNWKMAWRIKDARKSDVLKMMRGTPTPETPRDLYFFNTDEDNESIEDLIKKLAHKMENKVSQLKSSGSKGILLVHSPLIHKRNLTSKNQFQRLHNKVVTAHPHVEAAIIIYEENGPLGDPRYAGTILQPDDQRRRSDILEKLEQLESKGPIL